MPVSAALLQLRRELSDASPLSSMGGRLAGMLTLPGLLSSLIVFVSIIPLLTPWYWLAPLPSLTAVFFLLILRAPEFGFYLVVALIPFGGFRRVINEAVGVNIYQLLILAVFVVVAVKLVVEKTDLRKLRSNLWPLMILFLIVCVISSSISDYPVTARNATIEFAGAGMLIMLALLLIDENGFRRTLPRVLIWSVTASGALAVIGFFFEIDFLAPPVPNGAYRRGAGGAYAHNALTVLIIFILPLIAHQIMNARDSKTRLLYTMAFLLNLLAIASTYSRGGALMAVAVVTMIAFEHRRRFRARETGVLICSGLLLCGAIAAAMPSSFWQRQSSLAEWDDGSLNRRASYVTVALDTIPKNPIWGAGPETFPQIYFESETAKLHRIRGEVHARRAHNTYLEVLVGTGFVGFALFMGILWRTFANFFQAASGFRAAASSAAELASLVSAYRLALFSLLLYLLIFSSSQHKFMLLSFALSQIALNMSRRERE